MARFTRMYSVSFTGGHSGEIQEELTVPLDGAQR